MENYWWLAVAIPAGAVVLAVLAALYLDWSLDRHNRTLQDVMDMEIGEGVTLAQGIDAYYGGKGWWRFSGREGVASVDAGMRGPAARLCIVPKTGEIKIWGEHGWDDVTERGILFGKLVKAAKERKADEERDGPDPVRRDLAYGLLNGFLEQEGVEPSGDAKKLMSMADLIYRHRVNLCERAGLDFEDEELEAIVTTYERMNRMCAEMMYDSGWHAGNRTCAVYEL